MSNKDILALDNQLCFSLYATSLAITQLYKPMLEPLNLTYPQYLVMMILWESDGVSLNHIAGLLGQQPGAITPVIKRLAEQGYLNKARCENDERQLQICLTAEGRALKDKAYDINNCIVKQCGLEREDLGKLKSELDEIRRRIVNGD